MYDVITGLVESVLLDGAEVKSWKIYPLEFKKDFIQRYDSLREFKHNGCRKKKSEQECIPVGCVPSVAVAVRWGDVCPRRMSTQGGCLPRESAWTGVSAQGVSA